MMAEITGQIFDTSQGKFVVYNEQVIDIQKGQIVSVNGKCHTALAIIPPSRPEGKWSIKID